MAQVRALFGRLAAGAATAQDAAKASDVFRAAERRAALDPRRRIVDLWRQAPPAAAPTLDSLKRFSAATFGADRPKP